MDLTFLQCTVGLSLHTQGQLACLSPANSAISTKLCDFTRTKFVYWQSFEFEINVIKHCLNTLNKIFFENILLCYFVDGQLFVIPSSRQTCATENLI